MRYRKCTSLARKAESNIGPQTWDYQAKPYPSKSGPYCRGLGLPFTLFKLRRVEQRGPVLIIVQELETLVDAKYTACCIASLVVVDADLAFK